MNSSSWPRNSSPLPCAPQNSRSRKPFQRPEGSDKWLQAAQEEMDSLVEHDTWSLTKLPPGRKIVGSKWVFKLKHDENGEAARYKCRLVAQGYTQAQGIDYHETFAPVARFGSIRTLLDTADQRDMHIHQMDLQIAFLNGEIGGGHLHVSTRGARSERTGRHGVSPPQITVRTQAIPEVLE